MTILIATTFFCQLFVAGLPLLLVFVALGFLITMTISSYYLFDHVKKRISSFLDSGADTYQIDLSIKTFQSGGIFGKGPGQGGDSSRTLAAHLHREAARKRPDTLRLRTTYM